MSREEFLNRLKEDASSFSEEELQGALKYYGEYIADAHEEDIEQAIRDYNLLAELKEELKAIDNGDGNEAHKPAEASQEAVEIAERAVPAATPGPPEPAEPAKTDEAAEISEISEPPESESGLREVRAGKSSTALKIMLLVCFSPILVPVAVGLGGAVFGLLMAFLSVSFALGTAAVSALIAAGAGIFSVGYGIMQLMFANIGDGLWHISTGLVGTGIGLLVAWLLGKIAFWAFKGQFKLLGFVGKKIIRAGR